MANITNTVTYQSSIVSKSVEAPQTGNIEAEIKVSGLTGSGAFTAIHNPVLRVLRKVSSELESTIEVAPGFTVSTNINEEGEMIWLKPITGDNSGAELESYVKISPIVFNQLTGEKVGVVSNDGTGYTELDANIQMNINSQFANVLEWNTSGFDVHSLNHFGFNFKYDADDPMFQSIDEERVYYLYLSGEKKPSGNAIERVAKLTITNVDGLVSMSVNWL